MNVSRITFDRLYNLGSYEHVKYSLSVDVEKGESSYDALLGVERILESLRPESKCCVKTRGELERSLHHIRQLRIDLAEKGDDEFIRRYGHFVGTPLEYIERCDRMHHEEVAKREKYEARAAKARQLLDDLGGAAKWKDAKLDWEDGDNDY